MSSLNKVTLIGNLGSDPEIRTMQNGDKVVNLSVATSDKWKDKATGDYKEKTEWHRVVVFNQGLVKVAENYLKKGSKVYLEGQVETRSWEQDGQKKYTTEIVMRPYKSELKMLDSKGSKVTTQDTLDHQAPIQTQIETKDDLEDEIPF